MENNNNFDIPIVSIVYKRLDKTKEVYERIKEIKPNKLYVISDGPKSADDEAKVQEVRNYIDSFVDWNCEVHKRYSDRNLGLRYGIPSGLNWVFEKEEKAIILEDDIVPQIDFFHFCKDMLLRYENEENVMMISGFNYLNDDSLFADFDITFSYFACIWGWATWKRAWNKYRNNIPGWQEMRRKGYLKRLLNKNGYRNFKITFDDLQYQWYNSWAFQWTYAMFENEGLGIIPKHNMIMNIGINDPNGEHCGDSEEKANNIQSSISNDQEVYSWANIPTSILQNEEYDNRFQNEFYPKTSVAKLIKYGIRASIHNKCRILIKKLEMDKEYFDKILPEKYKLSEQEIEWNNGSRYREISANELRKTARDYKLKQRKKY